MRDTTPLQFSRAIRNRLIALVAIAGLVGLAMPAGASPSEPKLRATKEHAQGGSNDYRIQTLSARNSLVSGGDVLVRIDVAAGIALDSLAVKRNGEDVTASFHPVPGAHAIMGLVTGLELGDNQLTVGNSRSGGKSARLEITNFPITGPIISGPHEQPFFCTT